MAINVNIETICPNRLCSDNSYEIFFIKYLANSVYGEDVFLSVLEEIPTYSSFILGKTIFDLLNSLTESYRRYKNYEFLNTSEAKKFKNYKYYMNLYKIQFNTFLDKLQDLIDTRIIFLNAVSTSVSQVNIVTNLENPKITYDIRDDVDAQRRITYIRNIITDNINIFNNLINSYKASFPEGPILT